MSGIALKTQRATSHASEATLHALLSWRLRRRFWPPGSAAPIPERAVPGGLLDCAWSQTSWSHGALCLAHPCIETRCRASARTPLREHGVKAGEKATDGR
eukprot:3272084-Pyramimonas_sp.AAC.1